MKIPYQPLLRSLATELRKRQTRAEALFWQEVRNRNCLGYKFYRQRILLNYIVDFYCRELKLVIEIDGGIHSREQNHIYDKIRSADLESYGLTLLRYSNEQILSDLSKVLEDLKTHMTSLASSPPEAFARDPARRGGEL
jgi:very-short-patch-repair endonuclease